MTPLAAPVEELPVTGGGLPRLEVRLPGFAGVAAVTTRPLNFGRDTDAPAREVAAAHRVLRAWAWPRFDRIVGASQVHGTRLYRADELRIPEAEPAGAATVRLAGYDGFLSATPGVLLTVGVADCVPAFLWAGDPPAVALVHAGWRGAAGGILDRAVAALGAAYGVEPAGLSAWWGPAIGPCCYPVGEEVVEALRATAAGPSPDAWLRRGDGETRIDLRAALTRQAEAAGIPARAVGASARCTACDPSLHSYRRARGGGGRMLALAGLPRT